MKCLDTKKRKNKKVAENPKKKMLIEAARIVFLKEGLYEASIDDIAKAAGLSKRTIYKYFLNRDELLAEALAYDFENWKEWFFAAVSENSRSTKNTFEALLNVLHLWINTPEFRGCLFARVLLAHDATSPSIRAIALACARQLLYFFKNLAQAMKVKDPEHFARSQIIYMLILLGSGSRGLEIAQPEHLIQDLRQLSKSRE